MKRKFLSKLFVLLTVVCLLFAGATSAFAADEFEDGAMIDSNTICVRSDKTFREAVNTSYNMSIYDHIEITEDFSIGRWAWINFSAAGEPWKHFFLNDHTLTLTRNPAFVYCNGFGKGTIIIKDTSNSPNFSNTFFWDANFQVVNSTFSLSGNSFGSHTQIHVDATSTFSGENLMFTSMQPSDAPEGLPEKYTDINGKAVIPLIAEEGATVNLTGTQLETVKIAAKTYYVYRTVATAINADVETITFDRAEKDTAVINASATMGEDSEAKPTNGNVKYELLNVKADEVAVDDVSKYLTLSADKGATTTLTAKPLLDCETVTADLVITAVDEGGATKTIPVTVTDSNKYVQSVTFEQAALTKFVGESVTLEVTVTPSDATNGNVNYTIDNNEVATLDGNTLKLIGEGTVTVTATAADGSGKTATLTVTAQPVKVTSISVEQSGEVEMKVGQQITLEVTVLPENATDKTFTVTSSDTNVVSVNENVIYAEGVGSAVITVTPNDGSQVSASFNVTVTDGIEVTSITVAQGENVNMSLNSSLQLDITILPDDATVKTYTVTSSNTDVVTVDNNSLTAVGVGEAVITVAANDKSGVTATVNVTVKEVKVTTITIKQGANVNLKVDDTLDLDITILPDDATVKTYTVTSSNSSIVRVGKNNKLLALGKGEAVITVAATDGSGVTAKITVKVTEPKKSGCSAATVSGAVSAVFLCAAAATVLGKRRKG